MTRGSRSRTSAPAIIRLAEAFSGWRDSPGHRANMLKSGVTEMGIAAAYAAHSKYKVFWSLVMAGATSGGGDPGPRYPWTR